MQIDPIAELQRRFSGEGERVFPFLWRMLRDVAENSIVERDGVLLLGHCPELAPEAYSHALYPPLPDGSVRSRLSSLAPLPGELQALYRVMNGATLFGGAIEVWGLRVETAPLSSPAFDIVDEASEASPDKGIAFASNNCGDTVWVDLVSCSVRIAPRDRGLATMDFRSLDEWIRYCKEVDDAQGLD